MTIRRVNGARRVQGSKFKVQGGERRNVEHGTLNLEPLAKLSDLRRKSPPALRAEQLRAGHTCSRSASCPCATCETALCDGSGCPAYGRKRLRPPVRDVTAPTTSPCPGSSGSGRQVCGARLHRSLVHVRPNLSKGEWRELPDGRVRGILPARVASYL